MPGGLYHSAERALWGHLYFQACRFGLLFGKGDTFTVLVTVRLMFVAVVVLFVSMAVFFVLVSMAFVAMLMAFVTMVVLVSMRLMLMRFVVVLMLVSRIVLASTRSKKQCCTYTSQ